MDFGFNMSAGISEDSELLLLVLRILYFLVSHMFIFLWFIQLLQKLLDDRRPTVELIKKEGGKVLEMADSVDKEKIGKEIDSLGNRWDALLKKAESR